MDDRRDEFEHATPRDGYDRWAAIYDEEANVLFPLEEPVLTQLLGECRGLRVADIGCGTGRWSLRLAAAGNEVTGVDFSSGMLDVLRAKPEAAQLRLVEHDLREPLPLDDASFDLVLCSLVLEHLEDLEGMLMELARICAIGGRVMISEFHPEMIRRGLHARFDDPAAGSKVQIDGASYRPVSAYVMAAQRAGLRIEHISEHLMDRETVLRAGAGGKWIGEPLLLVLELSRPS